MRYGGRLAIGAGAILVVAAAAFAISRRQPATTRGEAGAPFPETARRESIRVFWETFRRAEAARLSGSRDRLLEAEGGYREALSLQPDHEDALWQLANVLVMEGRRAEAIDLLRRHITTHARSTRGFARLGDLLSDPAAGEEFDAAEAEAMYRHALSLNPEESGGYVNLGRLLYRKGDLAGAEAQFRSALKINFKSLVAARYLALIALRKGAPAEAAAQLAVTLGKFMADKPRLFALSEGDVLESEGSGRLTPSAREIFPAAEFLWLLARRGAVEEAGLPPAIRDLAASPLEIESGGRAPLISIQREGALARPRSAAEPAAFADRVVEADFDRDGVADRLVAGPTEAAESAAWILTAKILCGERAVRLERGLGGGQFEPLLSGGPPRACLPSGRLSVADVNGDALPDLRLEPDGSDPARVEPEVHYIGGTRAWTLAGASPRAY